MYIAYVQEVWPGSHSEEVLYYNCEEVAMAEKQADKTRDVQDGRGFEDLYPL